ncbi:pectinesterase [Sarracenia purpurea var. burkii]
MGTSMATKVVLLLVVVFTISVILAFQTASADEETSKGGVLSRNVSEQSIQEREARVRPRLVREMKRPPLATARANVVVAQDGSGNYRTVKEALDVSRRSGASRFVIHVKRGIYR